jgi:hypothetical protein
MRGERLAIPSSTGHKYIGEILTEILLDILPGEIKKSGKGREYFEEEMLRNWFPDLTEDEKVLVLSLTKAVLDRAFPT